MKRHFPLLIKVALVVVAFCVTGQAVARAETGALRPEYLRCEYKVNPEGIDVAAQRLTWVVTSEARAQKQTAYRIIAAGSRDALEAGQGDLWDSGRVESDETAHIVYGGAPLGSRSRVFWKVRVWDARGAASDWSQTATWSMGLLEPGDWRAAWIGHDMKMSKKQKFEAEMSQINNKKYSKVYLPCPYLRKEFAAGAGVRRATVYATALGFFELHINGRRVGNDSFTPGWTDYNKRVYYLTYDVTDLVRAGGGNAIGAILSDGWYAGNVGGRGQRIYGSQLRLRAQLHIEYDDGTEQVVASDGGWCASEGPIREADMQAGETYDARRELTAWSEPGFDDSSWKKVDVTESVGAAVEAYPGIPVRKIREVTPIEITEPKPGVFVFNMGQNFSGCARLKVSGNAGDRVVLRFAERLNPDGTIYTENLRGARVTDTYILKGAGEEIWAPRFTYHGFQYVEATGYPGKPGLDAITGIVMNSDLPETSTFETSMPLLNKLYSNIVWGQRSNYIEVPTDCPQRDERLGWMGDAQVFVHTAAYNMDIGAFFTKWMVDIEDAQHEDGAFHDVAPGVSGNVAAGWGDAGIICPWFIYLMYGDTRMLEKHYDSIKKWMDFLEGRSVKNLSPPLGTYGDWLHVNQGTDVGLISAAYYARDVRLMERIARALGRTDDAERYGKLFGRIAKAFNMYYVSTDGKISGGTQTSYLMALNFGLLPDRLRGAATERLVAGIKDRDWGPATGFLGAALLLPTLTDAGRTDVAYRLITRRKYPSWGYTIDNGATTMWERWDGWTLEKGFQNPGMNSFNHYAFGAAGEWMFATMAGIDTETPGFKKIVIRPAPGGGITWVNASYNSIRGEISSRWKLEGDDFLLDVAVPANTAAMVYVPAANAESVFESGRQAKESEGVRFDRMEQGAAVFETGSGRYSFMSKGGKTVLDSEAADD